MTSLTFTEIISGMILAPGPTYEILADQEPAVVVTYYGVISFIYSALTSLVVAILGSWTSPIQGLGVGLDGILTLFFALLLTMIISLVVGTLIVHISVWLMNGSGSVIDTLRVFAYAETPSALIGWIPIVGWPIASLWSFILLVIGISRYHQLRLVQSLIAVLLPVLVFGLLMIAGVTYITVLPA